MKMKLQNLFLQVHKYKFLTKEIYERIRPVGSLKPRMYGLPKIHKPNVPLRLILWNDKILVLKKTTLQLYFKTFIEKINSGNLIML